MKLIVEMEKVPKNCDDSCWGYLSGECPWSDHVDGYTMNGGRPRNCPIKGVLPDEHGDLIDRDEVKKEILKRMPSWCGTSGTNGSQFCSRREMLYPISRAKAVIAAERKDE